MFHLSFPARQRTTPPSKISIIDLPKHNKGFNKNDKNENKNLKSGYVSINSAAFRKFYIVF